MSSGYYDHSHLERFRHIGDSRPELAEKFFEYYEAVFEDGDEVSRKGYSPGEKR